MRLSALLAWVALPTPGVCQVSPDGTLSTEVTTVDDLNFVIEAGDRAGNNLFHSFEQFSVPTGGAAYFNQAADLQNIISRVTGGTISDIDGEIRANGTTNVFLINPSGIVFGPDASLNIGGSFVGTTAQQLRFLDGTQLIASDSSSAPQLTMSRPVGLQLTSASGPITVLGNGHRLGAAPPTFETLRTARAPGLQVGSDQTLALVGNNLVLQGGNLTTPGGRIDLGSVSNGEVTLLPLGAALALDYGDATFFQDIQMGLAASVDASGAGGGDVQLQGRRLEMTNGSAILSDTLGGRPGGTLAIRATEGIRLGGLSPDGVFVTGIYANVGSTAGARGSDLVIQTGRLQASNGGLISASTYGAGESGDILLRADQIDAVGTFPNSFLPTQLINQAAIGSTGNGGDFLIEAARLSIADGAQVGTGSFGAGRSGNLTVNANVVEVAGTDAQGFIVSGLFTQVDSGSVGGIGGTLKINADEIRLANRALVSAGIAAGGTGRAGSVDIETTTLSLSGGSQVTANTRGQGDAGDVRVRADSIEIEGFVVIDGIPGSSAITSSVSPVTAMGNGGNISIIADRVALRNAGAIVSFTGGQGDAGNIEVDAREVALTGFIPAAIATLSRSSGAAGSIRLNVDDLSVTDESFVSVSSELAGLSGNLDITAGSVRLTNGGFLSAEAVRGDQGSINVRATDLLLLNDGGQITTTATGTATGGNINIDSGLIFLNQDSAILARAIAGSGGNIQLTPEQILQSDDSLIDASSALGVDGTVSIERVTPETDPNPVALPEAILTPDRLVADSCLGNRDRGTGQFIISGAGGLSPSPNDPAQASFETYRIPTVAEVSGQPSPPPHTTQADIVAEAQVAYRLEDGRVRLARSCR
ncbi:MAG: filamentous hemagglutinin N-terminal domain-containing protein [Cyanobacteria bacterium P01_G01_bin.38]